MTGIDDILLTILQFADPETDEEHHFLETDHLWGIVLRTVKTLSKNIPFELLH